MRLLLAALLSLSFIHAADEQKLALAAQAQTAFHAVETAAVARLTDSQACVQAQAAFQAVAGREELAAVHYRKGVCVLAGAGITGNAAEFQEAASEFDKAIESWPASQVAAKGHAPEPVPSALRVLAVVARLKAGVDDSLAVRAQNELSTAEMSPACAPGVLEESNCRALLAAGHQWLGWLALRQDNLSAAAREFSNTNAAGWIAWANGRTAFRGAKYAEAAQQYRVAAETWAAAKRQPSLSWSARIAPPVDLQSAYRELGAAQLLAGDAKAAIETLNLAVKDESPDARALYLRARAKEIAGMAEAAQSDYNLASRTAFATGGAASGEAHLYRGILFYGRKDFAHAEDEFSSALNFEIADALRADASAWRQLAAVAGGACGASRENLERMLPQASPYFPREEARTRLNTCVTSSARGGL